MLVDYGSDGTTDQTSSGNTYWAGTNGQNAYFVMDLGQEYSIFQNRMKNTNNGTYGDRWTEDFKISISTDGVNFSDRITNTLQKNVKMTQAFKATKPAELDCEIFMPLSDKNLVPFNDSSSVILTNALAVFESE